MVRGVGSEFLPIETSIRPHLHRFLWKIELKWKSSLQYRN
ncbi:uncharacterized protein METZ01_LOCUS122792, partial [marine metagenome]